MRKHSGAHASCSLVLSKGDRWGLSTISPAVFLGVRIRWNAYNFGVCPVPRARVVAVSAFVTILPPVLHSFKLPTNTFMFRLTEVHKVASHYYEMFRRRIRERKSPVGNLQSRISLTGNTV